MAKDLRSYLEQIEDKLLHVDRETDVVNQLGELISQAPGPIMFHQLKDYPDWHLTNQETLHIAYSSHL